MLQNKLHIFVACFTIALLLAKENHWFFICFYGILYKLNRNLLKEVHWCHNVINMERLLLTSVNHTSQRYWEVSQYTISRKVFRRNAYATILKGNMGYDQFTVRNDWGCRIFFCCFPLILACVSGLPYHSFKFLWRTVPSKPPTIPFRIVACTFSNNLSQNSCIKRTQHFWAVTASILKPGDKWPPSRITNN